MENKIDLEKLPKHIGIIMDGNGRWAKEKNLPRHLGHKEGMNRVIEIVEECHKLKIKSLTLYAFSTENWKRPEEEISYLMKILIYYIKTQLNKITKNNIKINILGDVSKFPEYVQKEIDIALSKTKHNDKMILNIALNYGGRDEIIRATKLICKDVIDDKLEIDDIDKNFPHYLYSKGQDELDLLIRSGGEKRVSNFLLYQLAYAEFCFTDVFWPDFTKEVLHQSIIDYQNRDRRFGGI